MTGQKNKTPIVTTEEKLLREKMRTAQIYSKIGKSEFIKSTKVLRNAIREYAKDIPVDMRNRILSKEKFASVKNKKELTNLLDQVDTLRVRVVGARERLNIKSSIKTFQRIAREKGLEGRIKMKARKELGVGDLVRKTIDGKEVRRGIDSLNKEQLLKYKKIITDELQSKVPQKLDKLDVNKYAPAGSSKEKVSKKIADGIERSLGVISTNIRKYGGDKLFSLVRERRFDLNILSKRAANEIAGFQKAIRKLSKKDHLNLEYNLYNQSFDEARRLLGKNSGELDKVIGVLDDIQKRAQEVGLKVGKLENYFPRIVEDYNGLFKAYNKKFGQEGRSYLDKLLSDYANSKAKSLAELSLEEKADVLTKALRGYGYDKINIGNVSRARKFKQLDPEFLKFYHKPEESLIMYIQKMNDKITLKKLFGFEDAEQETIGAMIEKMNLAPDEMFRLKESLCAVLAPQGKENWVLNKVRKSATLTLLSSVSSTLFQVADIGVNAYKHGVGKAVISLIRSKPIKRDELFTDITHEFSDSNFIKNALKAVGFDRLDRLNNEAFMANAFRQASGSAKKGKGRLFKEVDDYANVVFRGNKEKIAKFMEDVKNKNVTDEVRLYIFNKALDVNPRVLEEMPEAYAANPNARVFYSMKSYGIKILDMYRNDVARQWKKSPVKSAKNFILLTSLLGASGATGSQIRDWYNGKDTKFSDNVINNMINLSMLSTYDAVNIKRDGLGKALMTKMLPPSRVVDDISQDILSSGDGKGLKSLRDIPVVGMDLYNRVGRGRDAIEKANAKTEKETSPLKKTPLKKLEQKPLTKKPLTK